MRRRRGPTRRTAGPRGDTAARRGAVAPHDETGARQHHRSGAPWHFWLVVVMATVYLGWRAVEGVVWLVQWIA